MDVSSQLAPMDIHQVQSDIHAIDLDNIAYGGSSWLVVLGPIWLLRHQSLRRSASS